MTINTKTGRLFIENKAASDVAKEFGTPCYVYSKNSIKTNFNRFKDAFGERKNLVCYAVKANSNIANKRIIAD